MISSWTADHVGQIDLSRASFIPPVEDNNCSGLKEGLIYWDMWPVQTNQGCVARVGGRELWMVLSAPDRGAPLSRHFDAKIRLLERRDEQWFDLGDVLPKFDVDYEREWAGSAVFDGEKVSLFFTAAGKADRPGGYEQRLFETHAGLGGDGLPRNWSLPMPAVSSYAPYYMSADIHHGEAGKIKAFRDPAFFCDPADDQRYLIFSGSVAGSTSDFNGAMGIAKRVGDGWELLPPLIHANGVNNEMERAHVVAHDGRYYAFWATQTHTFSPELRHAPTGLYGMVADSLFGEYRPLNGSGLVFANPHNDPAQTYSWFVTGEFIVSSFIDFFGLDGKNVPFEDLSKHATFGGTPAPLLRLEVFGDQCRLAQPVYA